MAAAAARPANPTCTYVRFCFKCKATDEISVCVRCRFFSTCPEHNNLSHFCNPAKPNTGASIDVPRALGLLNKTPLGKHVHIRNDCIRWANPDQLNISWGLQFLLNTLIKRHCQEENLVCICIENQPPGQMSDSLIVLAKALLLGNINLTREAPIKNREDTEPNQRNVQQSSHTYYPFCHHCDATAQKVAISTCEICHTFAGCPRHRTDQHPCEQQNVPAEICAIVPQTLALLNETPLTKYVHVKLVNKKLASITWKDPYQLDRKNPFYRLIYGVIKERCRAQGAVCVLIENTNPNFFRRHSLIVTAKAIQNISPASPIAGTPTSKEPAAQQQSSVNRGLDIDAMNMEGYASRPPWLKEEGSAVRTNPLP